MWPAPWWWRQSGQCRMQLRSYMSGLRMRRLSSVYNHTVDEICLTALLYRRRPRDQFSGSGLSSGHSLGPQQAEIPAVLDGVQLVCGDSSMERKDQTMRAVWASDPVHPNGHIYAKMALNLIEKIAPGSAVPAAAETANRKRSWSASNRDEQSEGASCHHWQLDSRSGYGSGGGSGGNSGNRQQRPDIRNTSPGESGRSYNRRSVWKSGGSAGGYASACQHKPGARAEAEAEAAVMPGEVATASTRPSRIPQPLISYAH